MRRKLTVPRKNKNSAKIVQRKFGLLPPVSFLLFVSLLLSLASCAGKGGNDLPLRPDEVEIPLSPPEKPARTVHPLVRPLPPDVQSRAGEFTDREEIKLDRFLVHHVHQGQINSLVVSSNGREAYSAGQDGTVVHSNLVTGPPGLPQGPLGLLPQSEIILKGSKPVLALALSSDERKLAVTQYSLVLIYDIEKRVVTNRMKRTKGRFLSVAWDPRGEFVLFGRPNGDVFLWNLTRGKQAGEDSSEALETYEGASSPIVGMLPHPSARAFFVGERYGGMFLWRLLRTEEELGLRDKGAIIDKPNRGRRDVQLGTVPTEIKDLWLNGDASKLFAAATDGKVYRWKIRGLLNEGPFTTASDGVLSMQGVEFLLPPSKEPHRPVLVLSSKGQRIGFWCPARERDATRLKNVPGVAVEKAPPPPPPAEVRTEDEEDHPADLSPETHPESPVNTIPQGLIAQSELFRDPLNLVRVGKAGPYLWITEKSGNLLTFNMKSLLDSSLWFSRAKHCSSIKE